MEQKIFDIHVHFGRSLFQRNLNEEQLRRLGEQYPGLKACLIPCKPYNYLYGPANKAVEQIASSRWFPILRVDPWREEEAIALIKNTRSTMLFLHPFEEQIYPTHPRFQHLVEEAAGRKMKVMIACGYVPFSHSAQVFPLIKSFPKVPFILTHGGQINICGIHMEEAFEIFEACPNTFFETSGIYREDYMERAIDKLGSQRVLFGSGTPYYDLSFEIKRIQFLHCEPRIKEAIFYENAEKLLGV